MLLACVAAATGAGSPQLLGGRHLAAKGNMDEQRNVRGRSGWLLAIVSAILISMGIQFMWYRAASASFGLEVLSFVCLME
jgi:hypothetical protein